MRIFKRLAFLCLAISTALLISEIILQLFWHPAFIDKKYQRDDLFWTQSRVTLNGFGYRVGYGDQKLSIAKKADTLRIYSLGDSYTYGWYLDKYSSYPDILEKLLSDEFPNKVEVINASQPGFSPEEELQRFENEGILFSSDIVTIGINIFDLLDKEFKPPSSTSSDLNKLKLYQLTVGNAERKRAEKASENEIRKSLEENSHQLQKFRNQLLKLNGLVNGIGGKLVLIIFPEFNPSNPNEPYRFAKFHQEMKKIAGDQGILFIDPFDEFNNIENKKRLILNPVDSHPSAFAHQIVAQELKKKIDFKGIIESGNVTTQIFYEKEVGMGDSLDNLHSIAEIFEGMEKATYFSRDFGLGVQKTPFQDGQLKSVPYMINYLMTAKSYTHDGWPGAKIEINLLADDKNKLKIPKIIYGYPIMGISQVTGFYRKKGYLIRRDFKLSEVDINRDSGITVGIIPNQKFDFFRIILDVGVTQADLDQGKIVDVFETDVLRASVNSGKMEVILPVTKKIGSLPKFVADGQGVSYVWIGDRMNEASFEIKPGDVVAKLSARVEKDLKIEFPIAAKPDRELIFNIKYL